jgi:hypothetical protein
MDVVPVLAVEHEDDAEADERAECEMVQHGLTVSSARVPNLLRDRNGSILISSDVAPLDHGLQPAKAKLHMSSAVPSGDFSVLKRELGGSGSLADADDPPCQVLRTALILPFCFFPDVELDSPPVLANALLSRLVHQMPLWERCELSQDVSELSSQFKQLLGLSADVSSSVQRLRVTEAARRLLFSEAWLWADTKAGDFAGKRCEWTDIHIVIFPHGAILSVAFDWLPVSYGPSSFTLSDLRNWIYVAKFRSIKVGVTRGWSFAQLPQLNAEGSVMREQEERGVKLFAALYGGSCVSLASIANWLVKMPWDSAMAMPKRVSRFEYAQHYTYCSIDNALSPGKVEEYLFHIRRAQGWKSGLGEVRTALTNSKDQVIYVRSNVAVGVAREGIVGLVWNSRTSSSFQKRFFGVFLALTMHCLSERVTLEKLSYLEAISSQFLPLATDAKVEVSKKESARREIVALATSVVRYRTCMATDDCGGRPECGEFFKILRSLFSVAELKKELGEEVHDMLTIVNRDWNEERQRSKKKEMLWKIKRDELAKEIARTKNNTKLLSDVASNAVLGVCFPFMVVINIFTMNVPSVPSWFPWSWAMIIAGSFSGLIIAVFLVVHFYFRAALLKLKAEKQLLSRSRAERLK